MTLSERNLFFKIEIFFCAAIILLVLAASFFTIPFYQGTNYAQEADYSQETEHVQGIDYNQGVDHSCIMIMEENTRRPDYIFQIITGWILGNDYYAVFAALMLAALYSFIGILLIHSFFERTPTPEILYIAIFTISLSFEAIRLLLPLNIILNFPSVYLRIVTRVLLFARFFGIFSLFTAGLCAAGLDVQKTRNAIFIIIIAVLVITGSVPIDVHSWDTGFNLTIGYTTMFRMIELLVFITTIASFFIAAKVRDSKEYVYAGVGVIFALTGRNILLGTDNWIGVVLGILLLSFGTWFLCRKVHKIHLWL
jgi:hypothetical protein